jgi:hypothetical protein
MAMGWRRVVGVMIVVWATGATAQTLPWPADQAPQRGSGPSGALQTLCGLEVTRLGQNVENLRAAAKIATERKAKRAEVCQYLSGMAQAASQLRRYANANGPACGLDADTLAQIKDGSERAIGVCRQICILEPAAGRLDDVPPEFATPIQVVNTDCGEP